MSLHVWASIVGRAHEHEATERARKTKVATGYGWRVPVERVERVIYELTMNWHFANIAIDGSAGIGLTVARLEPADRHAPQGQVLMIQVTTEHANEGPMRGQAREVSER